MSSARPAVRAPLLLMAACVLCYLNALTGDFQFDDYNVIVYEPRVHSWEGWLGGLSQGIRPLLKFFYTLDWTMDTGVLSFHLSNLLIHFSNVYLVYRLAGEFMSQQRAVWQHAPLLTALLFAVHPIHTEAITYICGRSAALMSVFYLAANLSYVLGRTRQNKILLYAVTPLLFALALAIKETAVTLPLALLLWELGCGGKWRTQLKPLWPSWMLLACAALFFLFSNRYNDQMLRSAHFNSMAGNLATQLEAITWLAQQWVLPFWLNIDPDLPLRHRFADIRLLPLLFVLTLCAVMFRYWRKRPWLSFAIAWMLLHLLPLYILLPRLDIANERQMYLAGWPLFMALTIEMSRWLNIRLLQLCTAVLLLLLSSLTIQRNSIYANEITLWEDTVRKSPNKARAHNNLGYAYLLERRYAEAKREFNTALTLNPTFYKARYNLYRMEEELSVSQK